MSAKMRLPHEMKIINSIPRLVRENFTIEFRMKDESPVLMQNGMCYDAGGDEVPDPPAWVWEQYARLSDEAKAKLKMTIPAAGKAK